MRKLVTIRQISDITPIEDADAIETAVVDGWTIVVRKGEFTVGQSVLYHEIDSILPSSNPLYAPFMARSCKDNPTSENTILNGHRLRTIKLRKQLSQGLVIALPDDIIVSDCGVKVLNETTMDVLDTEEDLSHWFGVMKYEKQLNANLAGIARGNFPSFIPKTDQERVQNLKRDICDWADREMVFEVTEKLDGSSCTIYKYDALIEDEKEPLGVCSRNIDLKDTEGNAFWDAANQYDIHAKLVADGRNLAIQGEVIGDGIQGNKYKLVGRAFYVFDIYDIDAKKYFTPDDRINFCKINNLLHVPVLERHVKIPHRDVMDLIPTADGVSMLHQTAREGLVYKCEDASSVSFKIISNKWLMKNED